MSYRITRRLAEIKRASRSPRLRFHVNAPNVDNAQHIFEHNLAVIREERATPIRHSRFKFFQA